MGSKDVGHLALETMSFAKWYNKWLYSLMKKYLGQEILEVGAGIGNFTALLGKEEKVTAIDINDEYLLNLKKKLKNKVLVGFGDIEKGEYFFDDLKFDSIVCLNVLEHIEDDFAALKNMHKLLKDGGHLILLVPAHRYLFSNLDNELGHYRRYSKKDLDYKLKKVGFKLKKNIYINWWAAVGWLFFVKLTGRISMPQPPVKIFDVLGKIFLLPEKIVPFPFGLSLFTVSKK